MSEKPAVDAIFCAAIEIESADQRQSYLNRVCSEDAELLQQVDRLLQAHYRGGSIMDAPAHALCPTRDQPPLEQPGTQIGPYKLLQEIGEGGMGVVYMAEQRQPIRRKVALKIIKPGMDTRQVIARFEAEEQALSLMDHPNIARVIDAGTTEGGRPFFVMELVKGQPITQYCDQHQLTPRERLELFLPVCHAIQHAHQKGIVHRDIKPSNILVAQYDQQPVPKVIDFGVAKAISQPLTEKTMFTGIGQVVGTLEYMSPEQAQVNQLDIDTRTDVYALGVLLYELLTGTPPFDKQRLRSAAWDEMLRIIREEEPPKPSTRLSSSETLASVAANRHIEPAKLSALVRGELDWIVMKALDKDRNRRYETASKIADDVQHYLNDEAVEACPPSPGYRFKKFARRNKIVLTTSVVIFLVLLSGVVVSTWQSVRATRAERLAAQRLAEANEARSEVEQERDRAEQQRLLSQENAQQAKQAQAATKAVLDSFVSDVLSMPGPVGKDVLLDVMLENQIRVLGAEHSDTLKTMNSLAWLLATEPNKSFRDAPRAVALASRAVSVSPSWAYLDTLGVAQYRAGNWLAAIETLEKAIRAEGNKISNWCFLAMAHGQLGNQDRARRYFDQVLESIRDDAEFSEELDGLIAETSQVLGVDTRLMDLSPSLNADYHAKLGLELLCKNRLLEAESELCKSLELREQVLVESPSSRFQLWKAVRNQNWMALLRMAQAKPEQAEEHLIRAIDLQHELLDNLPNPVYLNYMSWLHENLSDALLASGRGQAAEQANRDAIRYRQLSVNTSPSSNRRETELGTSYYRLGLLLFENKKPAAAEMFRRSRKIYQDCLTKYEQHPDSIGNEPNTSACLAWFLATCPDPQFQDSDRAIRLIKLVLRRRAGDGPGWSGDGINWCALGVAQYRAGNWPEAIEAVETSNTLLNGGNKFNWFLLAMAHFQAGNMNESGKWYERAASEKTNPVFFSFQQIRLIAAEAKNLTER